MMLMLEIEYLVGVSFAAMGPDSEESEWPPQPDRVFSALVAAWAARGEAPEEAEALRWLERQPAPEVHASSAYARSVVTAFVPPNDARAGTASVKMMMPEARRRQPRQFPAVRPADPVVRLAWRDVTADDDVVRRLDAIARDVAYVGHSTSLVRCRAFSAADLQPASDYAGSVRGVYPGRLDELRSAYAAGRRPSPGRQTAAPLSQVAAPPNPAFSDRWLLLEHVGGVMPDLVAAPIVARTIRDALLSGYKRIDQGHAIPEEVSGHTSTGDVSRQDHLAIIPLPFVGSRHADGHVLGYALVPPAGSSLFDDAVFRRALGAIAPLDEVHARRVMTVQARRGSDPDDAFSILLSLTFEVPSRHSLNPSLYVGSSREFATVTPIVLDRHLKTSGVARMDEMAEQVARACINAGLPTPELVVCDKHSAFKGTASAYPSGRSPAWTGWRVPRSLASRQLTHAMIRFPVDVSGPVLLGAGRFTGLGLCRPLHARSDD